MHSLCNCPRPNAFMTMTSNGLVVGVNPKPLKGLASALMDEAEKMVLRLMHLHRPSHPPQCQLGNFGGVPHETSPVPDLPLTGHLPECLNGEFLRVRPNPKFSPLAGCHWFDADGTIHGLRIKDGKASYASRCVQTSRLQQEEFFGAPKFLKIGDVKGPFGLLMLIIYVLRQRMKVLDISFGAGTANTSLKFHHGKLLALHETDKPYVIKILDDGDLQTVGILEYDDGLTHPITAHPKIDPITGEMFVFGCSIARPYLTYRVISRDGSMHEPVPIMTEEPTLMHDFAITENHAIFMDLPMCFRLKETFKGHRTLHSFDATKRARFGVLPRYATDESEIRWFELPSCFIFHNVNAWEEGEVVLITCRLEDPELDALGQNTKARENWCSELYEMRFNLITGEASQKRLSAFSVEFPKETEACVCSHIRQECKDHGDCEIRSPRRTKRKHRRRNSVGDRNIWIRTCFCPSSAWLRLPRR